MCCDKQKQPRRFAVLLHWCSSPKLPGFECIISWNSPIVLLRVCRPQVFCSLRFRYGQRKRTPTELGEGDPRTQKSNGILAGVICGFGGCSPDLHGKRRTRRTQPELAEHAEDCYCPRHSFVHSDSHCRSRPCHRTLMAGCRPRLGKRHSAFLCQSHTL